MRCSDYFITTTPKTCVTIKNIYISNLSNCLKILNDSVSEQAVNIMEEWLRKHEDNPYPSDEEKESFLNQTKLSINQINYWFTNARRRKLPKWQSERQQVQEKPRNAPQSSRAEEE